MATRVDQVLEERRRVSGARRWRFLASSLLLHAALALLFWLGPNLFARAPEPITYVDVMLIPAARLGTETPRVPPPPKPEPEPEQPEPEPAPPPPPPKTKPKIVDLPPPARPPAREVPVLAEKKTKSRPEPKAVPPPPSPPPASPLPLPDRRGSRVGNPLGISATGTNLGVEDPDFQYDYYVERIRAAISEHWVRPPVGGKAETRIYFRIAADGELFDQRMLVSSGSEVFDRAAMRAVANASPLPPLPKSYKKDHLGVTVLVQ